MKNKRGAKLVSIWWFFILGVVGLVIVGSVLVFYSKEINVNGAESEAMYNNLADCMTSMGYLNEKVLVSEFDVFSECRLSKEAFVSGNFFFNISINDGEKVIKEISEGTHGFEKDCDVASGVQVKNFPTCTEKEEKIFYYEEKEIKTVILSILTASNQKGRRLN